MEVAVWIRVSFAAAVPAVLLVDLLVIFACFAVPPAYRHRAFRVGVVGALVPRAGFIAGGAVAFPFRPAVPELARRS